MNICISGSGIFAAEIALRELRKVQLLTASNTNDTAFLNKYGLLPTPVETLTSLAQGRLTRKESENLDWFVNHYLNKGVKVSRSQAVRAFIRNGLADWEQHLKVLDANEEEDRKNQAAAKLRGDEEQWNATG